MNADSNRRIVLIMAVAAGFSVANLYYNQPLLAQMGHSVHASARQIGFIPTASQIGYATGLLLVVPLGDIVERRKLIVLLLTLVTFALAATALAQNLAMLTFGSLAVGITTVVPQVLIPFSVQLSTPENRGKTVGVVMSGLLLGILLSRTLSGFISHAYGWRAVYWMAVGLMILLGVTLRYVLPQSVPTASMSYGQLLRSLVPLARREPVLRQAALSGSLLFGAFSAFWATLIFLLESPVYHYNEQVAGLFGLVGAAGAMAAPIFGRLADKGSPRRLVGWMAGVVLISWIVFYRFGLHLWGLVLGVILLDLGVQAAQVSNQTRVYALSSSEHSRLNTVFMVSYFMGGSAGSLLASYGWSVARWQGVSCVGLAFVGVALITHALAKTPERAEN